MPRRKKTKEAYKPKSYEATTPTEQKHVSIYVTMLTSSAWWNLSKNAQLLYLYMKSQTHSNNKLRKEYGDEYFYFNQALYTKTFPLYKGSSNQFYKDRKCLIDNGFIEIVKQTKNTREKMIYKLSDKWQEV